MEWLVDICGILLRLYGLYAGFMAVVSLFPVKKYSHSKPVTRFAVVIAARNEERVIGATVRRLLEQTYPRELYDVYVAVNNCTDDTAGCAARAGARVLDCTWEVRDKGQALSLVFALLGREKYDAYCVFDADNLVDQDFLARMNDAFCAGARVAKGLQRASNPASGWLAGAYDLYFEQFNLLYSRPRSVLRLSAKLMGTGFAVSRSLLEEMGGFQTHTLTEDTEFAVQCAIHGERVWWVPEAVTYDEQPVSFGESLVQRRRWSSGVICTMRDYGGRLLKSIGQGREGWLGLDMLMMLSGPYIQAVSLLPVVWLVYRAVAQGAWLGLLTAFLSFCGSAVFMALAVAALGKRPVGKMLPAILLYPVFLLTWYPLNLLCVFSPVKIWKPMLHVGREQRGQAGAVDNVY